MSKIELKPCPFCGGTDIETGGTVLIGDKKSHGTSDALTAVYGMTGCSAPRKKPSKRGMRGRIMDNQTNMEMIRNFTPEQFARFLAWLAPNFCHNQFKPIYHQEEHKNGTVSTCCDGKCTDCILRFLEAKDGIYSKFGEDKSRFEPDKDYHA